MFLFYTLLSLTLKVNVVYAYRILCVYPTEMYSHQSVLRLLTEELARHGNEVVVITPLPAGTSVDNITEIDVHDVSSQIWVEGGYDKMLKQTDGISIDAVQTMQFINQVELKLLDAQFNAPVVQKMIKDKEQKFDLIFVEACVPLSIMFAARFDAPVIEVSSFFGSHENLLTIGAPIHPLIFPSYNQRKTRNLSFWDKLSVMYTFLRLRYIEYYANEERNKVIRKYFGAAAPSVAELRTRIEMLFLNVHPAWADNLPAPPALLYLGALHLKEPLQLPEDLQTYLDSSRKGVIYVSLGSTLNISDLPHQITTALFNVFKSLPYDILLKAKHENVGFKLENLRIEKWLPQNDLLHHPNVKLFITHGGLQSIDEAIEANVPMVVMPITGDAWYNAQKCEQFGIGKEIDLNTLNEDDLRIAILEIAGNETYRRNIASLSLVLQEQRAGGLQRAVPGAARVAARAARPLRSPLADASLAQILMLDVLAAAAAGAAVAIVAAGALAVALYRAVRRALPPRRKRKTN
ncbi:UDP-glucosyltransferase 2 [Plutella xylostella]|uniref:UDP-glucosyltransferase 2 n=1 Tax=Plutella xylostella TaxID=51655 RepID=UPI00203256CF|nr:UDP-glucosyltransferase 2 [Plutella xylostella]